jgi:hypothetical protein
MQHLHKSNDPDALATSLLEVSARTHLKEFLSLARKDLVEKIDFTKGYDILDDEMPYYIPKAQLEQKNTFTLFIKTTLKTGKPFRFLLNTIWMGDAKFAVGIAEVPENVAKGYSVHTSWN